MGRGGGTVKLLPLPVFLSQHLMFGGHSLGCTPSGVEAGPVEVDDATLVVPRNWKEPRAWSADSPRTLFP